MGAAQVRLGKDRAIQLSALHVCLLEVGATQLAHVQLRVPQVCAFEIYSIQVQVR